MQQAPAPVQHPLPTRIQQAILAYWVEDPQILSKAVASRSNGVRNWFAVLFHDASEDYYWAIQLEYLDDRWEIVSDYLGFETVQEFHSKRLVTCFR